MGGVDGKSEFFVVMRLAWSIDEWVLKCEFVLLLHKIIENKEIGDRKIYRIRSFFALFVWFEDRLEIMNVVLFQKYQKAIFEILHLLCLMLVEVHPNLHPVKGFSDVVRFCRYKPYSVDSLTPIKILTYEVKHQSLVNLLIILLHSLNLENQPSSVGVGFILPGRHNIPFEKINGIDDL